jgi:hypothetical protein
VHKSDTFSEHISLPAKKPTLHSVIVPVTMVKLASVPDTLRTLLPVAPAISGGDYNNNNIKTSVLTTAGPPAGVISLVLEEASRPGIDFINLNFGRISDKRFSSNFGQRCILEHQIHVYLTTYETKFIRLHMRLSLSDYIL